MLARTFWLLIKGKTDDLERSIHCCCRYKDFAYDALIGDRILLVQVWGRCFVLHTTSRFVFNYFSSSSDLLILVPAYVFFPGIPCFNDYAEETMKKKPTIHLVSSKGSHVTFVPRKFPLLLQLCHKCPFICLL